MILQLWILEVVKIPMGKKTICRTELTANEEDLAEVKIQKCIFQDDSFPLFVIEMIPINNILRKYKLRNRFRKTQEKINHLMDDVKMFVKN